MELGAKFWLWVVAVAVGVGVGAFLIFALIGWAWYAWGFFGMLVVIGGVLIAVAWIFDRREQKRYEALERDAAAAG
jgi:23S rRNA A1618 N6-methylase RlmF